MILVGAILILLAISHGTFGEDDNLPSCEDIFYRVFADPNPARCDRFFVCMKGNRIQFTCDPETIFNARTNRCVPGDQRSCGDLSLPDDVCQDQFYSVNAHPSNCGRFFICMKGTAVIFDCDQEEIFSLAQRRCVIGDRDTCRAASQL